MGTIKNGNWMTLRPCEHDDSIQVVPLDDLREHAIRGGDCWCEPKLDVDGKKRIVVHEAKDGRK